MLASSSRRRKAEQEEETEEPEKKKKKKKNVKGDLRFTSDDVTSLAKYRLHRVHDGYYEADKIVKMKGSSAIIAWIGFDKTGNSEEMCTEMNKRTPELWQYLVSEYDKRKQAKKGLEITPWVIWSIREENKAAIDEASEWVEANCSATALAEEEKAARRHLQAEQNGTSQ